MPPDRVVLCGPLAAGPDPGADVPPVRLRLWGAGRNVRLRIGDVREAFYAPLPPALLDLLDLAAYVYAADQAVGRGSPAAVDFGATWRRDFVFRVPVREPAVWADPRVSGPLAAALGFLTDDDYRFEFAPLTETPPQPGYFAFGGTPFDGPVDDVMLFSGGLDSLAGAVQEAVVDGRRVLLVNHRSTEKVTPGHEELVRRLQESAGPARPFHLPVHANKAEGLTRDTAQRSRSFLFAAVGAAVAVMAGRDRLRVYENGVVSLNLPLSAQLIGGRASRTTHPRALRGLAEVVTAVTGRPFAIENPFRWETKADVVRRIVDAGCGELIGRAVSCGHTLARSNARPHCGDCSQCVDRRFAVLAAGAAGFDPADGYGVDLVTGARPAGQSRTLLAGYLDLATRVDGMAPAEFFAHFGEAGRAVRHLPGPADDAARRVYDLYRRPARQVNGVVDAALAGHAAAIRTGALPPTCLVRLVTDGHPVADECLPADGAAPPDPGPPAGEPPADRFPPPAGRYVFRRVGQGWQVRFAGGEAGLLLPSKGAAYLHELLARPGVPSSAVELAYRVARRPREFALGDTGTVVDAQAMTAFRARHAELLEERAAAERNNDPGALDRVRTEITALAEQIARGRGLNGRLRRGPSDQERVGKAVGNAIRRAVEDIREFDPKLADHLRHRIRCGADPRYSPEDGVSWET